MHGLDAAVFSQLTQLEIDLISHQRYVGLAGCTALQQLVISSRVEVGGLEQLRALKQLKMRLCSEVPTLELPELEQLELEFCSFQKQAAWGRWVN